MTKIDTTTRPLYPRAARILLEGRADPAGNESRLLRAVCSGRLVYGGSQAEIGLVHAATGRKNQELVSAKSRALIPSTDAFAHRLRSERDDRIASGMTTQICRPKLLN